MEDSIEISVDQKKQFIKNLLLKRRTQTEPLLENEGGESQRERDIARFHENQKRVRDSNRKVFGLPRLSAQNTEVTLRRVAGDELRVINMASYNYLGLSTHPEVIAAAKQALDDFGLGACASPSLAGTLTVHEALERRLIEFYGFDPNEYSATLFSSGFSALFGSLSALAGKGDIIFLDQYSHASIADGAKISGAAVVYYRHNDMAHLAQLLGTYAAENQSRLICTEGVFSADGDRGSLVSIIKLAKKFRAKVLVDEAHSALLSGERGRGECEAQHVLNDVDFIALTFSKGFAGIGGALIGKTKYVDYVSLNARCRIFSCAMDPAVVSGVLKSLEIAASVEGDRRRHRLKENCLYFKQCLAGRVDTLGASGWVVPIIFKDESIVNALGNDMHTNGLDGSPMLFPGVPKNSARFRLFITSEHTREQLRNAAEIIVKMADKYGFRADVEKH